MILMLDPVRATLGVQKKEKEKFDYLYSKLAVFSKEEVIGKFITLNNSSSTSINIDKKEKINISPAGYRDSSGITKLSINIGGADKMNPETLIRLVNKTTRSRDTRIGKIDINKNHTTFEVDSDMKDIVISKMNDIRHGRKKIIVSNSAPAPFAGRPKKRKKSKKRRR